MPPPMDFHIFGNGSFLCYGLDSDGFAADVARVHYAVLALCFIVAFLPRLHVPLQFDLEATKTYL